MTFKINPKDTSILCLHICQEDKSFNTSLQHNAVLILEDENGHKCGEEYIQLEEFSNYYSSFCSCPSEEVIPMMVRLSEEFDDNDLVEFILYDEDMINHLDNFRTSQYNQSRLIEFDNH